MAKGDDAVRRKKNKAICKKLRRKNDSSTVSAKAAAAIAAKKRRKAGKRRMCQGMCFSLPSPDDPFNDHHGKEIFKRKAPGKKKSTTKEKVPRREESAAKRENTFGGNISKKSICLQVENQPVIEVTDMADRCGGVQQRNCELSELPSKFVFLCLSSIENALHHGDAYSDGEDKILSVDTWGLEFLKCYSTGKDLIETSGTSATTEQVAWIVSGVADTFVRKEKQGLSLGSPFLLFLVPSQEKALQVRTVCKPLKSLGIHTVSIHSGATLDHQIQGLRSCEPEFLVSTPERLMELLSLKAIDISDVSILVVDGLSTVCSAGYADTIKSIKSFISSDPRVLVFNDSFNHTSIPMVRHLLNGSICRLSLSNKITSLSSCIIQSVRVCTSDEEKLLKSTEALDQFRSSCSHNSNMLYILRKDIKCNKLVKTLKGRGCCISLDSNTASSNDRVDSNSRSGPVVSAIDLEHLSTAEIGRYDVVVLPSFVPSMDTYIHILTKMARESVNGVLHSFLTAEDGELAGQLISILEQCEQEVPETLQDLHHKSEMKK
ncbi:DEAD-box ATP-dependent RNA helicase 5 [Arachis duranensis]|uniref:DEAD-box ATP-dependent RNA helicase 5 n=1 Tax=Arachis duranensis TaxID=130453 RepID=A0A6P4CKI7_ARADU|nr:DEAD-box ATP-dependent RNA helicase 5 [Arachis duranensis]